MNIQEIEAKKVNLETEMQTALTAAQALTPATTEFDDAYGRYLAAKVNIAKIPDELIKAKLAENAEAIGTAGASIADAIEQIVTGLKVEELLGAPVISLRYAKDAEGKSIVVFNPITKVSSKSTGGASATKAGRTVVIDAQGDKWSLTKFVLAHATEAEKASAEFKYPHTQVDSKPKFEEFCKAHNLTGYTYEVPVATTEAPAS